MDFTNMSTDQIRDKLQEHFSYGPYTATVDIQHSKVTVSLPVDNPTKEIKQYNHITDLCDQGRFTEAKEKLDILIERSPRVSDYWRIKGQIAEIENRSDDAINDLINALKWDPNNTEALIMMGNVYARHHKDIDTALVFFKRALESSPNDVYALNNVGGLLFRENKFEEAIPYFQKAIEVNPKFIQALHGLGLCAEELDDHELAFTHYHRAYLLADKNTQMKSRSLQIIDRFAQYLDDSGLLFIELDRYTAMLEKLAGVPIEIEQNDSLNVMAKVLIAEVHNLPAHTLQYKNSDNTYTHLMMHELVHLEFILEARHNNCNMLFTATDTERASFNTNIDNYLSKSKTSITKQSLTPELRTILFDGLNSQIYNTPIDLFIEQRLYDLYPTLRPIQFLSLNNVINMGIKATTDPKILRIFPAPLVSKSRTLNLVLAMQYKALYGVDLIADFKATHQETRQAETLYNEYLDYKNDRKPGEEYEIISHWGQDLKLDKYFRLKPDPHNIPNK